MAKDDVPEADLADMQALIGSGFSTLAFADYLLLDVVDTELALGWLREVVGHVQSLKSLGLRPKPQGSALPVRKLHAHAWSIALTYRGLVRLGVVQSADAPFPTDFCTGQSAPVRRRLLRDDPGPWQWGDAPADAGRQEPAVSLLIARFHDGSSAAIHRLLETRYLETHGLAPVRRLRGCASSFRRGPGPEANAVVRLYEPFGFRDGLAQPSLQGLRGEPASGTAIDRAAADAGDAGDAGCASDSLIPLGEVVLGHRNAFGELSHSPEVRVKETAGAGAFGRNGCYLAVRQIAQDLGAFRAFESAHPAVGGGPTMGEKMVGRYKEGAPLQTCPARPTTDDGFRFRSNDSQGFQCPIGAHIRRANPRDGLAGSVDDGVASSKLHRLLRRGRPYAGSRCGGDVVACAATRAARANGGESPDCGEGLFFIALVGDLARQFEFVKRIWIANPNFGGLHDASDPLIARDTGRRFMVAAEPLGTQVSPLANFTRVEGGGYFFLPGLAALARLAEGDFSVGHSVGNGVGGAAVARAGAETGRLIGPVES